LVPGTDSQKHKQRIACFTIELK